MATNGHTLYGSKQDWHVWKVLVTAKYAKAKVTLQEAFDKAEVAKHAGTDRLPVLKTAEGIYLSQSNSMVRYIARVKSEANMYGTDAGQQSQIDGWIDFSLNELELPAAVWTYPLLGVEGYNPSDEAVAQAKVDVKAALDRLNSYLKDHTYLVGDLLSAADIALASACTNLYKLVMTEEDRAQYKAVTRWFFTCINQPAFQSVVGKVETSAPAGGAKVASTRKPVVAQGSTASAFSATQIKGGDNWKRKRMVIRDILEAEDGGVSLIGQTVTVAGWARSIRSNRFIQLNDGSTVKDIQCVLDDARTQGIDEVKVCGGTSACLEIVGEVVKSQGRGQTVEVQCDRVIVHGKNMDPSGYPMARTKKGHSMEFLREKLHLRPRTNIGACVTRVRNACAYATHTFFQSRGFKYIHTPLISGSDCEGAGEQFLVTTLMSGESGPPANQGSAVDPAKIEELTKMVAAQGSAVKDLKSNGEASKEDIKAAVDVLLALKAELAASEEAASAGSVNFEEDFFGKPAYLTVSGQLNAEIYACALKDVYTFGPTFRAENSNTTRHLAEFWMVEPEMAFATLEDDMACAEAYLKHCVRYVLENCKEDMEFFEKFTEKGITERLTNVAEQEFATITYTEAVETLMELIESGKHKFEFPVTWGCDLQSEHERYITEVLFNSRPVIVTDYPKGIKAFYMRENEDKMTVAAMDVLVPKVGELMGGSQREERLDVLKERLAELGLPEEPYWWYLELRKYGSVPHAGFGLGFERLVQFTTGVENIRDVIPFPRHPGSADF